MFSDFNAIIGRNFSTMSFTCSSTFLKGEYNQEGICIGVPTILGRNGIEKIIEFDLNQDELEQFNKGVQNLKNAVAETKL